MSRGNENQKIKARDVAKFIVTHKGQLNEYLNRPMVDQDKACARLLLHKALQDKYKIIRERFSNISIKDLLMSRQERRKLKKEERDKQKNKKKNKDAKEPVQAEGDWNVEDINIDESQFNSSENDVESSADEHDQVSDNDDESKKDEDVNSVGLENKVSVKKYVTNRLVDHSNVESTNVESSESSEEVESDDESEKTNNLAVKPGPESSEFDDSNEDENAGKFVKIVSCSPDKSIILNNKDEPNKMPTVKENKSEKKVEKKHKDNDKNKNLKNKILLKKFSKEQAEIPQENKVVDPFFITASGENYMSVAEPRPPDEVKEVHKQGNRKYRRAVMFGHIPKAKPRRDVFRPDTSDSGFGKFDDNSSRSSFNSNLKHNGFDKRGYQKKIDAFTNSSNNFKHRRNDNKKDVESESKPEKLHPSWEAKKRQSGILPFQGKKIVFDEG